MLRVVQIVFAGRAEEPRIFLDRAEAEAADVEYVLENWKPSYSAYCDEKGTAIKNFAAAKGFTDTLDMSERSRINSWSVGPDTIAPDRMADLEGIDQQRKRIGELVRNAGQRTGVLRDGLTALLDDLFELTECLGQTERPSVQPRPAGLEEEAAPAPPAADGKVQETAEKVPEKYAPDEWKTLVVSVKTLCGGGRSECSLFTRHDWRQDVYGNTTSLEYWDRAAAKVDQCREKAKKAGYDVIPDSDSPGNYRIRTPEGTVEEEAFFSELDAWCHAAVNMHG